MARSEALSCTTSTQRDQRLWRVAACRSDLHLRSATEKSAERDYQGAPTISFEVVTTDNLQRIALSHRRGAAPMEALIIGLGTKAIALAVLGYAKPHDVMSRDVEYAVRPVPIRS